MIKEWKDIQVGDIMKDGSIVTQIHHTHLEDSCKVVYNYTEEFICSYNHVLLVDISNIPIEAKNELEQFCTFVPLEESYSIDSDIPLTLDEMSMVDRYFHNESVSITVDIIEKDENETYDFHFDTVKRVYVKRIITKSEPQKVDENTYWLSCRGIKYLMDKYDALLYCNELIINDIISLGKLPCFCISTNTGKYET